MEMPNNSQTNTTTTISILPPQQLSKGSHHRGSSSRMIRKEEVKIYMYSSTEWRVDERTRVRGKHEDRTDTFYYNYILKKQFRSLEEVAKYIETGETPKRKRRGETAQNAITKVKASTSDATKAESMGEGEQMKQCCRTFKRFCCSGQEGPEFQEDERKSPLGGSD